MNGYPIILSHLWGFVTVLFCSLFVTTTQTLAQATVSRDVVSGGGGTTGSGGHTIQGTLSQTGVGRLKPTGTIDRHDVGFWYKAYQPEVITTVSLPAIETNVETHINVELRLESEFTRAPFRPFFPRPFTARIRLNGTLLHPLNLTPNCSWDGNDCIVEIHDTASTENGVIATLEFLTALGNADRTAIEIEEFTWVRTGEERISVVKQHGSVALLDVCREGDHFRLIRSGSAARLTVWPNPASTSATIEFTPNEAGVADIRLVDVLGSNVVVVVHEQVQANQLYKTSINLTDIPGGTYMIVFQLPSETLTRRLVVRQ